LKTKNPASFQKQGLNNLFMASPFKKRVKIRDINLLTMPYLNLVLCAPNALKSQETNLIYNHLKGLVSVDFDGFLTTGRIAQAMIAGCAFVGSGCPI